MERPDQRSVSRKKALVRKASRPGNMVINFCAATCHTARACVLLDRRRRFVGCDVYSELLTAAETNQVPKSAP